MHMVGQFYCTKKTNADWTNVMFFIVLFFFVDNITDTLMLTKSVAKSGKNKGYENHPRKNIINIKCCLMGL